MPSLSSPHHGPPYANGNIHVGHALNKILKDVINKYNILIGKNLNYIPGWDCHGLPIERAVEKELSKKKIRKESVPKAEFRKLCREYAKKYVEIQKKDFIRLGVLGDWNNSYLTMDPKYEAQEIRELGKFFEKGLAYRSKKPVYWCIYDKTAEAEAEVEYYEKEDPSIYVKFPIKNGEILSSDLKDKKLFAIIWTTTPWTLSANLGIMVKEDANYVLIDIGNGEVWILAEDLVEEFFKVIDKSPGRVITTVKGKDLVGLEYSHPFIKKEELKDFLSGETLKNMWKIYPSEFVSLDTGTGLVHMAPGHGQEDYTIGRRYGLEPYAPLNDEGRFVEPAPEFLRDVRVFDANPIIIKTLEERGFLV
ncbi:MAG TPA: isoleucine--tRNA ligase, partial [Aquificaceae bacterium]|nr:isoleucine--tRNA ligase [Aquificaceae bacterium]